MRSGGRGSNPRRTAQHVGSMATRATSAIVGQLGGGVVVAVSRTSRTWPTTRARRSWTTRRHRIGSALTKKRPDGGRGSTPLSRESGHQAHRDEDAGRTDRHRGPRDADVEIADAGIGREAPGIAEAIGTVKSKASGWQRLSSYSQNAIDPTGRPIPPPPAHAPSRPGPAPPYVTLELGPRPVTDELVVASPKY
jgi:hypothetical protein